jgi:ABC-type nitrate/sulfonate/bicarbonate transport system permease component
VVGLVGATGLGSLLLESLTAFAWDQLLALVVVYATLTLIGEDFSDRLRHRLLGSTRAPNHLSNVLTDVSVDGFKMGESA